MIDASNATKKTLYYEKSFPFNLLDPLLILRTLRSIIKETSLDSCDKTNTWDINRNRLNLIITKENQNISKKKSSKTRTR